jgi:hypothetical protein
MELVTLKGIRFVVPAAIIFVCWWLLGKMMGLSTAEFPDEFTDANLYVIICGALYYVSPLRDWANRPFHNKVSANLRTELVRISDLPDNPQVFTWNALRGIFYWLIDHDVTLSKKATLLHWNGAVWTSCADVRAVSVVFAASSFLLAWLRDDERGVVAGFVFAVAAAISVPLSSILTKRQKKLGREQLEVIEHFYQDVVKTKMEKVLERSTG